MKVLVASKALEPIEGDYNFCVEGELVYLQEPCGRDRRDPDGGCGCGRGFSGLMSHRACTTASVVETELSEEDLCMAIEASLEAQGWLNPSLMNPCDRAAVVGQIFRGLQRITERFEAGTQLRRRLDLLYTSPEALESYLGLMD